MKKIFTALVIFCSILFLSCNSKDNDPKTILIEFLDAISKNDIKKARSLATKESKSMLDLMDMGNKEDSAKNDKFDKKNIEFGEVKIEGDKATVPVTEKKSGITINYILKNENGWKVAFDKATMMNMGMDTETNSTESNILQDSIANQVGREVEGINKDSLKKAINDELKKALDSENNAE